MAKTQRSVGVKHNDEEMATLEWLMQETMRDKSSAIKWAVAKTAKELGYAPKTKKKPTSEDVGGRK